MRRIPSRIIYSNDQYASRVWDNRNVSPFFNISSLLSAQTYIAGELSRKGPWTRHLRRVPGAT